jgi:hypothetical protein
MNRESLHDASGEELLLLSVWGDRFARECVQAELTLRSLSQSMPRSGIMPQYLFETQDHSASAKVA